MTEKELSGLYYIRAQIARLEERIAELKFDDGIGAQNLDGMPHGTSVGAPVERLAIAKASLHEKLVALRATKIEKEQAILDYIESVDREDVKLIMEMRFIRLMDWYNIAGELEEITGRRVERSTPAKKMRKYLREHAEMV